MNHYFIKTPNSIKLILKNWVWSFSSKEKNLYLTFDDGPTPEFTNWILNELDLYHAKATFFCVGENLIKYPDIAKKITDNNHTIGNHTHNHLNGFNTSTSNYIENVELLEKKTKLDLKLFRPPYGKLTFSQSKKIRKKGYKIIMWDVLSADFDATVLTEQCLRNVIANTQNGSIIVFHDNIKSQEKLKYVLPKVLEYYAAKGYNFKAIN
jgi:peptidoglycan/xylan/chitin deacetylase (PgdA/CDA1 family)